jgi:hypothetical protein
MRSYLSSPAAAVVLALGAGVHAQQYAGDVINNTLPSINGAAINYFKIPVASKKGGYGTLLNYYSAPKGQRLVEANVQRVVIAVHGLDEDPWVYWQAAYSGLMSAKKQNPAINESSVAIIAPFFANGDGKGVAYPWTDGLPPGEGSVRASESGIQLVLMHIVDFERPRLAGQLVGLRRRESVSAQSFLHFVVHRARQDHPVLQQRHTVP